MYKIHYNLKNSGMRIMFTVPFEELHELISDLRGKGYTPSFRKI